MKTDVPRLIRTTTFLLALLAGVSTYLAQEPRVEVAELRLDADRSDLRSSDVAFATMPRLEAERARLARRYEFASLQNSQALFLRELASTIGRHRIDLLETNVSTPARESSLASGASPHRELFTQASATLELRGAYADLLAAIRDLSLGQAIVSVAEPAFHRDGTQLVATVPVTIFEPLATAR